jgi:hypothetical protein
MKRISRPSPASPEPQNVNSPPVMESDENIKTISTLEELDEKLREVKEAGAISDDKMREVFQSFKMKYPTDLPADPYSDEYSDRQFEFYRVISGARFVRRRQ